MLGSRGCMLGLVLHLGSLLLLSSHLIHVHQALLRRKIRGALTACKLVELVRDHVLRLWHLLLHERWHGASWVLLVVLLELLRWKLLRLLLLLSQCNILRDRLLLLLAVLLLLLVGHSSFYSQIIS